MIGIFQIGSGPEEAREILKRGLHSLPDQDVFAYPDRGFYCAPERKEDPAPREVALEDGTYVCALNGQIWNIKELGRNYNDSPPPETLLARLYRDRGPDFVLDLNGSFSLFIFRPETGTLFLSRDALGEKTLYYAEHGGGIAFASRMNSLLALGLIPRECEYRSLLKYLSYSYVPDENTLARGVKKLLPGEYLLFQNGKSQRRLYYEPRESDADNPDMTRSAATLRELLEVSIADRLGGLRSPGVFLSGGLDSSLVTALLARGLPERSLKTFSVSFGPELPNELYYSDMVARHCKTDHRVIEIRPRGFVRELPEIIYDMDEPAGDPITVPNYILAREATGTTDGIFNGEGGDPLFGGPKNIPMILSALYSRDSETYYLRSYRKMYEDLPFLAAEFSREDDEALKSPLRPFFADAHTESFLHKLMRMNTMLKGGRNILVKVAHAYESFGLPHLSPLFDRRIVDYAFGLPPDYKLRGRTEKYVLKKAVEDLLPSELVWREKLGMMAPVNFWFRDDLKSYARRRLSPRRLKKHGFFRADYVKKLLNYEREGERSGNYGTRIWMLLYFQIWFERVILNE